MLFIDLHKSWLFDYNMIDFLQTAFGLAIASYSTFSMWYSYNVNYKYKSTKFDEIAKLSFA